MAKANICLEHCINTPYVNREYSWLQFNKRVLDQARDASNPLLERCKFLAITTSNLDEFMKVRFGSLTNENKHTPDAVEDKTHMNAQDQMKAISLILPQFYRGTEDTYKELKEELYKKGLFIHNTKDMSEQQMAYAHDFFNSYILPQLSPLVLDAKHPMIQFTNCRSYLALHLVKNGHEMFGVLPILNSRERFVALPKGKKAHVILIEDLIYLFGPELFSSFEIVEKALIRVTRNADFEARQADADFEYDYDFSKLVEDKVENRIHLEPIRLEIKAENECPILKAFLIKHLAIKKRNIFEVKEYFDYDFLYSIDSYFPYSTLPTLRYPAFKGAVPRELIASHSLIDYVLKQDILLSYPFQSMSTLINLLNECAEDVRVKTIKITIYRLASQSEIVEALKKAALNGKEVTVVMELCARFDEERNLNYAKELQDCGCTVFYGIADYKVHSKIISIVLTDEDKVKFITHLGTGNYNEKTAALYTDLNLITSDEAIGQDGVSFFQNIATLDLKNGFTSLLVAPFGLKKGIIENIDEEIKKGEKGEITCKINSLTDMEIINKLIEASQAGVKVNLIVRGICCVLPGIEGLTENIKIRSIVGRFLEHSRVYSFGHGEKLYISSADFMTRNTDKRVEIATPIKDPIIKKKILHILDLLLKDNTKAKELNEYGEYLLPQTDAKNPKINAQEQLLLEARS